MKSALSDSVVEVVDLAFRAPLLFARPGALLPAGFQEVIAPSTDGPLAGLDLRRHDELQLGELCYKDFRASRLAEVYGELYKIDRSLIEVVANQFNGRTGVRAFDSVRRRLEPRLHQAADWIYADLVECALARAAFEGGVAWHERLIQAYKVGAWPVGCASSFERGNLLVVLPANCSAL